MLSFVRVGLLVFLVMQPVPVLLSGAKAQEQADAGINARIREEGMKNSKIMNTLYFLTDVYGPRLTGTPKLKSADDWAVAQLRAWGLQNAHLEPWDFGSPGWTNEALSAHIVSPFRSPLACAVVAWTPGTNGPLTARPYQMILPENLTRETLLAYLDTVRDKVKNRIVLVGKHQVIPINFEPPQLRLTDKEIRELYEPKKPAAGKSGNLQAQQIPRLSTQEISEQIDQFLIANGALLRVNESRDSHGVIRAVTNPVRDLSRHLPAVVMRNEDYGRLTRLLSGGAPVELEFTIANRIYPEGRTAYNAIAEITGTDKKDEVVMIGAHLDSHHLATGATDNAIGCAVMMEVARILKAVGVRPRRTIRIGLWSGEEQKALGSQAYVREHFGTFENRKPDFSKLDAYFNLDTGTGRIRGMRVFGPPEAAELLRQILAPFKDLGVVGAGTYSNRTYGGSDHSSFSMNGLPAFYIDQDPIEYGEFTWHTNLDTFERVVEDDAKQCAVVIAAAVYQLAMSEGMLPRFTREQMPPPGSPGLVSAQKKS